MKNQMYRTIQQLKVALIDNPKDVIMSPETIKFNMTSEDVKYILPYMQKSHIKYVCKMVKLPYNAIAAHLAILDMNRVFNNEKTAKELKTKNIISILKTTQYLNQNIFKYCTLNFDFLDEYKHVLNYNFMLTNPNISTETKIQILKYKPDADIDNKTKIHFSILVGELVCKQNTIEILNEIQLDYCIPSILNSIIYEKGNKDLLNQIKYMSYKLHNKYNNLFSELDTIKNYKYSMKQYRIEKEIEICELWKNAEKHYSLTDEFMDNNFDKLCAEDILKYQSDNITSDTLLSKLANNIATRDGRLRLQNIIFDKIYKDSTTKAIDMINAFKINKDMYNKSLRFISDFAYVDDGKELIVIRSRTDETNTKIYYHEFITKVQNNNDKIFVILNKNDYDTVYGNLRFMKPSMLTGTIKTGSYNIYDLLCQPKFEKKINNNLNEEYKNCDYVFVYEAYMNTYRCVEANDESYFKLGFVYPREVIDIFRFSNIDKKIVLFTSKKEYQIYRNEDEISSASIIINKIEEKKINTCTLKTFSESEFVFVDIDGYALCIASKENSNIKKGNIINYNKLYNLIMSGEENIILIDEENLPFTLDEKIIDKDNLEIYKTYKNRDMINKMPADNFTKIDKLSSKQYDYTFIDYKEKYEYYLCIKSIDRKFTINAMYSKQLIKKYIEEGVSINFISESDYEEMNKQNKNEQPFDQLLNYYLCNKDKTKNSIKNIMATQFQISDEMKNYFDYFNQFQISDEMKNYFDYFNQFQISDEMKNYFDYFNINKK